MVICIYFSIIAPYCFKFDEEKYTDSATLLFNYEFFSDGSDEYEIFYLKDLQQPVVYDDSVALGAITLEYPANMTLEDKVDASGRKVGLQKTFKKIGWVAHTYNLDTKVCPLMKPGVSHRETMVWSFLSINPRIEIFNMYLAT